MIKNNETKSIDFEMYALLIIYVEHFSPHNNTGKIIENFNSQF